ncbi:MAG: formylglycine-generating enzyme family protein [Rhodoferax sp.]
MPALNNRAWWAMIAIALLSGAAAWLWFGAKTATTSRQEPLHCALPVQAANAPHTGMVWVAGGSFEFGDTTYPEEQPIQKVTLTGFWMDRTEVTNDEFAQFVKATGYVTVAERAVDAALHPGLPPDMQKPGAVVFVKPNDAGGQGKLTDWWRYIPGANWRHPGGPGTDIEGRGAFPVVAVTIDDAQAYAKWKGRTLPSEAQWEWAARAGLAKAGQDHDQPKQANTWQGLFPFVNSGDDGFVGLAPAGCYPPNANGLFDMVGNVWELTTDEYKPYHQDLNGTTPDQVPSALRSGKPSQRVIKGGSFLCAPNYCMRYRSGARQPQDDDLGASHLGFRTILIAPAP